MMSTGWESAQDDKLGGGARYSILAIRHWFLVAGCWNWKHLMLDTGCSILD
jgi:hypothetical protein